MSVSRSNAKREEKQRYKSSGQADFEPEVSAPNIRWGEKLGALVVWLTPQGWSAGFEPRRALGRSKTWNAVPQQLFDHFQLQIVPERFWNLNAAVSLLVGLD
jgi:hypothetical protein